MTIYIPSVTAAALTFPLPDQPKPSPLLLFLLCLTPDDFTHQWRATGWEKVNGNAKIDLPTIFNVLLHKAWPIGSKKTNIRSARFPKKIKYRIRLTGILIKIIELLKKSLKLIIFTNRARELFDPHQMGTSCHHQPNQVCQQMSPN